MKTGVYKMSFFTCPKWMLITHTLILLLNRQATSIESDKFSVIDKREVHKPNYLSILFLHACLVFQMLTFEFKEGTKTKEWTKVYSAKVSFDKGEHNNICLYFANSSLYFTFLLSPTKVLHMALQQDMRQWSYQERRHESNNGYFTESINSDSNQEVKYKKKETKWKWYFVVVIGWYILH